MSFSAFRYYVFSNITQGFSLALGQRGQWNQGAYLSSQQASMRSAPSPGVAGRGYAPLPHPKKPAYVWYTTYAKKS